ncbi:MAG: ATP-dependent DNA helicase [Halobacteriales archaeon]
MDPERIPEEFPAPSSRGNQQRTLERIRAAFAAGNDVVLVRAPTGSGKSLLARAVMGAAATPEAAPPAEPHGAYYTTPQVSQLDDVAADPLLADLNVVRGKNNYTCILPGETDTPVDRAPCARESGFDCRVRHRCPYFSDRAIASERQFAAMTLAYFMQTAGSDVFGQRDVVVVDEAHGLAEWAEMYATIELDARTVPGWHDLRVPDVDGDPDGAMRFAERLVDRLAARRDELLARPELDPEEAAVRDRLGERISELQWFVEDYRNPESPTTWLVDQGDRGSSGTGADDGPDADGSDNPPVTVKPLNPERYLHSTVWDRGRTFALLSATILEKAAFCRQVGLDPDDVALVDVEHTFPLERRPLYDLTRGKMTYDERDETLPKVARALVRVMQRHPDQKGLVHAHSYAIQRDLLDHLREFGVASRVRAHDRGDRDDALAAWKATDDPDVFLSVTMEEALDLEGDLCRWQVLTKAPYANTGDSRVAHRLDRGGWPWYRRTALRTVVQAAGRVVRSPEDYGATYLADSSLLQLFENARADVPDWFADQIDRMVEPDLPPLDPDAAVGSASGDAPDGRGGRRGRSSRDARRRRSSGDASDGGGRSRDRSSPLADAWDVE